MSVDYIKKKLLENPRPQTKSDFEAELEIAKSKGYKLPEIDYSKVVTNQDQASSILGELGIEENSLFFQIYKQVRNFPLGRGEELNTLDQIVNSSKNSFWDDDFPGFSKKYLELSSIEGEGSYFYELSTGKVYDVDWGDIDDFVSGNIQAKWNTFSDFLEWYYADL